MRQYAWYSPEFDAVIFQCIMDNCYIAFEWDHWDLYYASQFIDLQHEDPLKTTLLIPLGEV